MSSRQESEPVIPVSTAEWQRNRFGYSAKREFKWAQVAVYNLNKVFVQITPSIERLNTEMAKIAEKLKKAKVGR
jgi:hypothetical protein